VTAARLTKKTLRQIPIPVRIPDYDLDAVSIGVVHFGPGAFFRGHVASYLDDLLKIDPRWAVVGVGVRSAGLMSVLRAQDCLYTLVEQGPETAYRILGALRDYRFARDDRECGAVLSLFDRPSIGLVTASVTEKGYCLDGQGRIDFGHCDIRHDVSEHETPQSFPGLLLEGLARRRASDLAAPVVMSCDNLVANSQLLRRAVLDLAQAQHRFDLASWVECEVNFVSTMVDSITPLTDDALRDRVRSATGLDDGAPVQREQFRQWVIEGDLGRDGPDLASVGATRVDDVRVYERAKLRLLNGAHSALSYMGLLQGLDTVAQAVSDPLLGSFVEDLMRQEIASTLTSSLDIGSYIDTILLRFRNDAIHHRLAQIAADGSLKMVYRWLDPIDDLLTAGQSIRRAVVPVAAWLCFVCEEVRRGRILVDPLADRLEAAAAQCLARPRRDVGPFLNIGEIFSRRLTQDAQFVDALVGAFRDQWRVRSLDH